MELENTIDCQNKLLDFITSNFFEYTMNAQELAMNNHSMYSYNFNKVLSFKVIEYSLFGLKVNSQYAYLINNERFCLYLLMDASKDSLDIVVNKLGTPSNVTLADYEMGDFDFLIWHKDTINYYLVKDRMGMSETGKLKVILLITNIDYKELINSEKIF